MSNPVRIFAAALTLAMPALAGAQQPRTEFEELLGRPVRAPVVPDALRAVVREATPRRLVVAGIGDGAIGVPLEDIETENLAGFANGRYLGFAFRGYEYYGYRLVDRRMRGEAAVIETGDVPHFSPDGRHFAAAQLSGAGFGNLEGVAIWRIEADMTVQIFVSDALPQGEDWRVDGWPRADCVAVSWVERQPADGEPAPERLHLGIEVGETIRITASGGFRGCNVTDATAGG